jgi:6-pyruvoyltetrahydropterin/6-carboxytetrahydropterin synthase
MTYSISKEFSFSAAHRLSGLYPGHPCGRVHGHNYTVKVALTGPLSEVGFVRDYGLLSPLKAYLDEELDHRWLGKGILFDPQQGTLPDQIQPVFDWNPTAENMAEHLYRWCKGMWPEVAGVGVSETPKTWAWYEGF